MRNLITILFLILTCSTIANEYKPMDGYSTVPLNDPVFDYVDVVVESAPFNNWLNSSHTELDASATKYYREHLYYLLSSYISELNRRDGVILPKESDLVLKTLFSWGERLGVYGAHLFYNKLKDTNARPMPELMKISDGIKISAENDMYKVQSKDGIWSVKFPYYFMISIMNEFTSTKGMATQLLMIFTGAAKDSTEIGRSQSTLTFVHSPTLDTEEFTNYWLTRNEISSEIKPKALGINTLKSFYSYNEASQLHREITFLSSTKGSYMVSYFGMDGAFQINRQHFLDFLLQVNTTQSTVEGFSE